jgi:uncharacterized membrane protein
MQNPSNPDSTAAPEPTDRPPTPAAKKATPTQFFLKGLAISLPAIVTLVILVWIGQMLYGYVVSPITTGVRFVIAEMIDKSRPSSEFVSANGLPPLEYCGQNYRVPEEAALAYRAQAEAARNNPPPASSRTSGDNAAIERLATVAYIRFGEWAVPYPDFVEVAERMRPLDWPATVTGLYMELVTIRYFKSVGSLSALATALTIIGLYFLGRIVTARMGQWVVNRFETLVLARVPIISSVYSSVKQVTDFFFSERPMAYNRVVAVEFPRRGVWTIGFAMGDSLMDLTLAASEPMISIMIPAAPMPMTGWVVSVPKSAVIDLNVTLDQAFQYFLSCGVLVPEHQRATPEMLHRELAKRLAGTFGADSLVGTPPTVPPGFRGPIPGPGGDGPPSRVAPPPEGGARGGPASE